MYEDIGFPEAVLDVRATRVSGWGGDVRLPIAPLATAGERRASDWPRSPTCSTSPPGRRAETPVTWVVRAGTEIRTTTGIQ